LKIPAKPTPPNIQVINPINYAVAVTLFKAIAQKRVDHAAYFQANQFPVKAGVFRGRKKLETCLICWHLLDLLASQLEP
jgi:hypothetical protein